jgi:hypothetical protein
MKFRWYYVLGLVVAAALAGIAAFVLHGRAPETPQQMSWKTANPVLAPASRVLHVGAMWNAKTQTIAPLAGSLANAEWYLPITSRSAVSYILHDGRARWVVDGQHRTLPSPPSNPNAQITYASNGQSLAWMQLEGGALQMSTANAQAHPWPKARAIQFNHQNKLVMLVSQHVWIAGHELAWRIPGTPAALNPFVQGADFLIVDRQGHLESLALPSGHASALAKVRAARWPQLVTAESVGNRLLILMERPGALPAWLLIEIHGKQVWWYRFVSPAMPELGTVHGVFAIGNAESNGNLLLLPTGSAIHPLNLSPGIFSTGPGGLIWQGSNTLQKLSGWHA